MASGKNLLTIGWTAFLKPLPVDAKKLRIGCSGWSYQDWVGPFYPKDAKPADYLRMYSQVFDAVEIDSSYYRTPSPFMVSIGNGSLLRGFFSRRSFRRKLRTS